MATASFEKRVKVAQKEAKTKQQLTEWIQKVYEETERFIQPLKPFMLIRTLPRSTITAGGILMPEKQNKPNIEAVVLAVYKPYWEHATDAQGGDISVYNECDVKVGDHIILPHFVGQPDTFLDEREHRLIREDDAIATLHYREKGELKAHVMAVIANKVVEDVLVVGKSDLHAALDAMIQGLFEEFDIVPKTIYSRITSGK
jgi:co-chaperonin GroES (HSP10)